jgi:hypothetical protein
VVRIGETNTVARAIWDATRFMARTALGDLPFLGACAVVWDHLTGREDVTPDGLRELSRRLDRWADEIERERGA